MDIQGQGHFKVNNSYCSMVRSQVSVLRAFGPLVFCSWHSHVAYWSRKHRGMELFKLYINQFSSRVHVLLIHRIYSCLLPGATQSANESQGGGGYSELLLIGSAPTSAPYPQKYLVWGATQTNIRYFKDTQKICEFVIKTNKNTNFLKQKPIKISKF